MGHRLPSLLCKSENITVAHVWKQSSQLWKGERWGKSPISECCGQVRWAGESTWHFHWGLHPMDVHRNLEITSTCWSLCVCVFWMWIPLPVFQRQVQAWMCQLASWLHEAVGRVLSLFISHISDRHHLDHDLLKMQRHTCSLLWLILVLLVICTNKSPMANANNHLSCWKPSVKNGQHVAPTTECYVIASHSMANGY